MAQSDSLQVLPDDNDEVELPVDMEHSESAVHTTIGEEDFKYNVITADQIVEFMVECIKDVNAVFQIPTTVSVILLKHFKWDKEKLMERYYDGDQDELFSEVHFISPHHPGVGSIIQQNGCSAIPEDGLLCEICYFSKAVEDMKVLKCGHHFCFQCLAEYLTYKIMDDMGPTISCAAYGCDILVDDKSVMELIQDQRVKLKYLQIITNNFVECNKLLRWCPTPDCGHAIKAAYHDEQPVTCVCGHTFCFSCGENWHDPVRCKWLQQWMKKGSDDDYSVTPNSRETDCSENATFAWIAVNTKDCPKCSVMIQKDGGCNHMICKSCKAEFCWVCLDSWPHRSSRCNRYTVVDATSVTSGRTIGDERNPRYTPVLISNDSNRKRSPLERFRQRSTKTCQLKLQHLFQVEESVPQFQKSNPDQQRYHFYHYRYNNHMQSLRFEQTLYLSLKSKMEEMLLNRMSWTNVAFLTKAVDVLCLCRQTLMYTYVFAFYLKQNNQSVIFEDNQKDLENATEQLSGYLERDISVEVLCDISHTVRDKFRYCESRRKVLLDHVHEGYERDYWEYLEV